MRTFTRVTVTGAVVLALGGLFVLTGNAQLPDIAKDVQKVADACAKGDAAGAKKQAQAVGKVLNGDVEEAMHLLRLRKRKGWGVGDAPGAITPDGIELMVQNLARDGITGGDLSKNGKALEQMAYRIAGIGEIAVVLPPEKDMGKKTRKLWLTSAQEMVDGSAELAKAIKSNSAAAVKTAATKLNAACTNCHNEFK